MAQRSTTTGTGDEASRVLDGGFRLVLVVAALFGVLVVWSALWGQSPPNGAGLTGTPRPSASSSSPGPSTDLSAFLARDAIAAPPIQLTDQDGQAFSLASLNGSPAFVFFGYTHCPDVCPATIGAVGKAIETTDLGARAVFVTVDPRRDTAAWLKEYLTYLPAGFVALTGSDSQIRTAADAWGVRYARVETGVADGYSMSHTANVYLVDGAGPFGRRSRSGRRPRRWRQCWARSSLRAARPCRRRLRRRRRPTRHLLPHHRSSRRRRHRPGRAQPRLRRSTSKWSRPPSGPVRPVR